jgi:hypothetical protein
MDVEFVDELPEDENTVEVGMPATADVVEKSKEKADMVDFGQVKSFRQLLAQETTDIPGKENIIRMFDKIGTSTSFARKVHKEFKAMGL